MCLRITRSVFNNIMSTIGKFPPERGGVLGAHSDGTVCAYYFDSTSKVNESSYSPDINQINHIIVHDWAPRNITLTGIIHSHDASCPFLSCGDLVYGERLLCSINQDYSIYLLIIVPDPFQITSYCLTLTKKHFSLKKTGIVII